MPKCGACDAIVEVGADICFECGEPLSAAKNLPPIREVVRARRPDPRSDDGPRAAPSPPPAQPAGGLDLAALAAEAEAVLSGRAQPTARRASAVTPLPRETKATPLPPLVAAPFEPAAAAVKAYKKFRDDEPDAVRCPGCGVPSRKDRCPGCGVLLRRAD